MIIKDDDRRRLILERKGLEKMRKRILEEEFCNGRIGKIRLDGVSKWEKVKGWKKEESIIKENLRIRKGINGKEGCFRGNGLKRSKEKELIEGRREVKSEKEIKEEKVRKLEKNKNKVMKKGWRNNGEKIGLKGMILGGCEKSENGSKVRIFRKERDNRIKEKVS